jgi:hypothetical protein
VPLVVILEKAKVIAGAAPRRRIERGRDRFTSALDKLDPEPLGQAGGHAGASARVNANHDLKCNLVGGSLGTD